MIDANSVPPATTDSIPFEEKVMIDPPADSENPYANGIRVEISCKIPFSPTNGFENRGERIKEIQQFYQEQLPPFLEELNLQNYEYVNYQFFLGPHFSLRYSDYEEFMQTDYLALKNGNHTKLDRVWIYDPDAIMTDIAGTRDTGEMETVSK